MNVFCKRRRKVLAPLTLAFWLFAIFVSIAYACGLDEDFGHAVQTRMANVGGFDRSHADAFPACEKFCSDDLPVLAKVKAIQDPPTGHALLAPALVGESSQVAVARVPSLSSSPDSPPGVAINIRFVRLAL